MKTATSVLPKDLITTKLGYSYDGDLVRIATAVSTSTPASDRKLWIIGATLGPVGFTLLLIFICCYLHYKCRPRPANPALIKVYSPNYSIIIFTFSFLGYFKSTSTNISK